MGKKLNTSKSVMQGKQLTDEQLKLITKKAEQAFGKQKKVGFSIPTGLQKAIGTELFIAVNGVHVVVPADGEVYEIPEILARHGQRMIGKLTT